MCILHARILNYIETIKKKVTPHITNNTHILIVYT